MDSEKNTNTWRTGESNQAKNKNKKEILVNKNINDLSQEEDIIKVSLSYEKKTDSLIGDYN